MVAVLQCNFILKHCGLSHNIWEWLNSSHVRDLVSKISACTTIPLKFFQQYVTACESYPTPCIHVCHLEWHIKPPDIACMSFVSVCATFLLLTQVAILLVRFYGYQILPLLDHDIFSSIWSGILAQTKRHFIFVFLLIISYLVFSHLCQGLLSHNKCLYIWYSHVYIEKELGSFASLNHNIYIAADRIPVDFGSQAHLF